MNIELARPEQASALAQLDSSRLFSAHWSVEAWQEELVAPGAYVWCAQEGQTIWGFLVIRGAADMYEIVNLAVAQNRCRLGIGSLLIGCGLEKLKTLGGKNVTLEVSVHNQPAQALYRKLGFCAVGVRKQFYADGADAIVMGKIL